MPSLSFSLEKIKVIIIKVKANATNANQETTFIKVEISVITELNPIAKAKVEQRVVITPKISHTPFLSFFNGAAAFFL